MIRPSASQLVVALLLATASSATSQVAPNLLYTSIAPCRVLDTRSSSLGKLIHNVAQTFNVVGATSGTYFTGQGGTDGGCNIPGFDSESVAQVQAVMFNFIAVGASGAGDLVAWPTHQPQPMSSIINYASSASLSGLNIANGIILPVRQDLEGGDISLVAQVSDTQVVADVIGYFSSVGALKGAGAGTNNVFLGRNAGFTHGTGSQNIVVGPGALSVSPNTASFNVAIGQIALIAGTGNSNTAVGAGALAGLTTGEQNTALGNGAGGSYSGNEQFNIAIGNGGTAGESNTIRIGSNDQTSTYIAGINGASISSGTDVLVSFNGQLGTTMSSRRFKEDVADMDEASAGLMQLRPVTFHYRPAYDDGSHLLQYGLIAEEVAAIYPDLVRYDDQGRPLAVRYQWVNAMLLNEVQRQHRDAAADRVRLGEQESRIATQAQLLTTQEQRASAQDARIEKLEALITLLQSKSAAAPPVP